MSEDAKALAGALAEALEGMSMGIIPERVYTPEEAADLCGWRGGEDRGRAFRDATRGRLPAVRLTPRGQRIGYYGRDLIRFITEHRESV